MGDVRQTEPAATEFTKMDPPKTDQLVLFNTIDPEIMGFSAEEEALNEATRKARLFRVSCLPSKRSPREKRMVSPSDRS